MKEFNNKKSENLVDNQVSIPASDLLYLLQIAEDNEQKYDSKKLDKIYRRADIALDFDY